jgi:Helicase associated domain
MMGSSLETVGALLHPTDVASSVEKATSSLISNHAAVTAERSPSKNDAASRKDQPHSPTQSEEKKQKAQGRMQALAATKPHSVLQAKWDEMFNRLLAYKATYGDCLVPNRYDEDPSLGAWVSTQRRQYKVLISGSCESTPMNPDRAKRLDAIGFVWSTTDPRHVPWETRYYELIDFKEQHGVSEGKMMKNARRLLSLMELLFRRLAPSML